MYRVGIGYDVHRLVERRKLILGGINIPYPKGLLGHSDADVLLHAICDALLGACGHKDIGGQFPDSLAKYKNISSLRLLTQVNAILRKKRYLIVNIDAVIVAEQPVLAPFKLKMRKKIARTVDLSTACVNVKATTSEGIGPIGRGQAISAYAVALLRKHNEHRFTKNSCVHR